MSTATMQSTPAIPPRPARSHDNSSTTATAGSIPSIPPRPNRFRSVSPNPDRFAPSPLNDGFNPPKSNRLSATFAPSQLGQASHSSTDLDHMGPGEEGAEYAAYGSKDDGGEELTRQSSASPEQTRTIGEDIKLHAPKPTMPAQSAKQRVAQVTRTDSDRAASFGIGRPSSTDQHNPPRTLRKKASTASQLSQGSHYDDDGGIPEIGVQVPMYPHAGDVQAPSPAPGAIGTAPGTPGQRHHNRKRSSRGFNELPPGSYGLHGHGVAPSDKLEKAYYEKHPELRQKEHYKYLQDRPTDFSMSSDDLNKIVRGEAAAPPENYSGTPSEQVGYQAAEEYTSRLSRPPSAAPRDATTPVRPNFGRAASSVADDDDVIHVDDRAHHRGVLKYGENESDPADKEEGYEAHILASDAKRSSQYELYPAVDPPVERRGSAFEMERPRSITGSRPSSIYSPSPADLPSTSLDDVEEYEPLFPEDEQGNKIPLSAAQLQKIRHRFPSRDIWEDAPDSVHGTAEVSTPDVSGTANQKPTSQPLGTPREGETPAQAFARQQEELAEKESKTPDSFLWRTQKGTWSDKQANKEPDRPGLWTDRQGKPQRFPSRDVWEDTPDSLQFTTTVSGPQSEREPEPEAADPVTSNKPVVPPRPAKSASNDSAKPVLPERPKPQIPARPAARRGSTDSTESTEGAKSKPAVPARPGSGKAAGGKIAALQAGFMSDLNKRLQLGPQAPKKEEPVAVDLTEEKEQAPLADARKGRARGPQRRAPTKSSAAGSGDKSTPPSTSHGKPVLSFSITHTLWSIDEEGTMVINPEEKEQDVSTVTEVAPESPVEEAEPKTIQSPLASKASESSDVKTEQAPATEAQLEQKSSTQTASDAAVQSETKTLATNTAGESILQESVTKDPVSDEIKTVDSVKDEVKE